MAKPDLHIPPEELLGHPTFIKFKTLVKTLAEVAESAIYVKFSGAFCELPTPGESKSPLSETDIADYIFPWLVVWVEAFSAENIIWGSDWPVCNVGYYSASLGEGKNAWGAWARVTEMVVRRMVRNGLVGSEDEGRGIWGRNGARAYAVDWPGEGS